ncbi:MAG: glutamate 5-kinase [Saprospiraceae bacterium]|jgi:glutamate 5-kinase|nr:glutamate 5-kinase [Saprospiraceae bacterium]MBL0025138.1 glutamate 5-kinase [Saprospiraceae bacterium]
MKKKIVVKIGTSTLTSGSNRISHAKIEDLARQIVQLREEFDIIVVSSGAIAAARQYVDISGHTNYADSKQAMAAIGQPKLMKLYDDIFESFGLHIAQCLLTYSDFEHDKARKNTKHTISKLLEHQYIPIINENDTVANEEILLGDNDKLSALVASIVEADILIIASDIDGLYDDNPHLNPDAGFIYSVNNLEEIKQFAQEKHSTMGTGGMKTKIHAAEICHQFHVEMWIVNGGLNNFIINALSDKIKFTRFITF